jgi:hypothetical protein
MRSAQMDLPTEERRPSPGEPWICAAASPVLSYDPNSVSQEKGRLLTERSGGPSPVGLGRSEAEAEAEARRR